LGPSDFRHATVMSGDRAAAAAIEGGGRSRERDMRKRRPNAVETTFSNVSVSTTTCRPRSWMGYETTVRRMPAGVHWYSGFEPRPRKRVLSPNPRRRTFEDRTRRIPNTSRNECQRNYMAPNHAVAGSSPAIPTWGSCIDRDVAQLDRARRFANPCRCVFHAKRLA
jgi:hypothetical protein